MHACVCALMPLLVSFLQRWTEDEQAQEELPRSSTDSAALWSRCPQVSSVLECVCVCVYLKHECLYAGGRILCVNLPYVISRHGFKRIESLSTLNEARSSSCKHYGQAHAYCTYTFIHTLFLLIHWLLRPEQ